MYCNALSCGSTALTELALSDLSDDMKGGCEKKAGRGKQRRKDVRVQMLDRRW